MPEALGGKLGDRGGQAARGCSQPREGRVRHRAAAGRQPQAIADAQAKLEAARKKAPKLESAAADDARAKLAKARKELQLAELDVPLAEAKHAALDATIRVERLEDSGGKERATDAPGSKRRSKRPPNSAQAALLEAGRAMLAAEQAVRAGHSRA